MSVLDAASQARKGLTLPEGTKSVELKGEGAWKLVFTIESGDEVSIPVPSIRRGLKLLNRCNAQLAQETAEKVKG